MAFQIDTPLLRLDTFGISSTTYRAIDTVWWLVKIIPLLYFTYGFFIVRNYHKTVLTQNSAVNERAIIWLYLLTIAYIGAGIWSVMLSVLAVLYRLPFGVTDNYINFCLLVSLYYFSVSFSQSITTAKVERKKNDSQTESLDNITGKIMAGITEDKLYLKANINVEQFSESIGLPYREVSFAINRVFGTNFFEFINTYRVEEAKRYLADERHLDMSVMDILLESGFNSKSSFQRFFKRLTGDSPTEYRKKMISQST
jgi:AraC-like DNA-binding protein